MDCSSEQDSVWNVEGDTTYDQECAATWILETLVWGGAVGRLGLPRRWRTGRGPITPLSGGRSDSRAALQSGAGGTPRGARTARIPRGERHHLPGRRRARGGGQPGRPGGKTCGGQT